MFELSKKSGLVRTVVAVFFISAMAACQPVDEGRSQYVSASGVTSANSGNDVTRQRGRGGFARFFSQENQRDVRQGRDEFADLETDAGPGRGRQIDTTLVNRSGVTGPQADYFDSLDSGADGNSAFISQQRRNIQDLQRAGAVNFEPSERVTIRFDDDPLRLVVDQLLGGLLSANYNTATPLTGTVTFETRTPILKSQVPTVLRDILAGRGFVMKLINGVYQIGAPATIAELEANSAAGGVGELSTRVIKIERGNVNDLADVVSRILPTGASVSPVPKDGSLIIRANEADLASITNLVNTLVDTGASRDLIAIISLRQSAPEAVAASVLAYYDSTGTSRANFPVVIPLENQQALLIGAKSKRVMANVQKLVKGLDRDLRDSASLRIIPLKHLPAEEISDQLNAVYGNGGAPNVALDQAGAGGNEGSSILVPAIVRSDGQTEDAQPTPPQGGAAIGASNGISIVPDSRNNALLVFATFKEFKRIREVVRALDLPLAQVVIEATIVEVDVNDNLNYGVQFFLNSSGINLRSSTTTTPSDPAQAGLFAQITDLGSNTVDVVLNALQAVTDVRVISSPYLTVLDGRSARLSIGDQIPFLTNSTEAQNDGTTTTTNQIEVRDTGIILEVTPRIGADNSVLLNISQEVSSIQPGGAEANELTPVISQRSLNSDIVVRSGKTALLGGLIQDTKTRVTTGVPVVSKIPVVGNLFKQRRNDLGRTELLVMITPRVVRKPSQLENITRQLRAGLRQSD